AVSLANMGRLKESYPLFKEIFAQDENWRVLLPRLVVSGLIKQQDVDRILKKVK
ncbi:MAG: Zn-dependent protease, partial [Candidatus Marinimicrobia bacterium]|nr:Zn-dependent protease [Candidatus Neomarinimicrobiota bacterium]